MPKEIMEELKKLEELTLKKLSAIRELQNVLVQETVETAKSVIPHTVAPQQELFDVSKLSDKPLALVTSHTLTQHIYSILEVFKNGEFTSRSLAQMLRRSSLYKHHFLEKFQGRVRRTLLKMRQTPNEFPSFFWSEIPRPGGGSMYVYRWKKG